jgi:hydroxymethylpyrimidine pyrophosphatase-like HAD family hydrolase
VLGLDRPLSAGLRLTDLLLNLDEVCAELRDRVLAREWLDAFLLASAAVQIVEDYLQPDTAARRAEKMLAGLPGRAAGTAADGGEWLRRTRNRSCLAWLPAAQALRDELADVVMTGRPGPRTGGTTARVVAAAAAFPAAARAELLRLPSALRTFDLAPADAARLAGALRNGAGGPAGNVVVAGIRTSGSYLGPLVAAALRADGVPALAITARPGRMLLPPARAGLREALARDGAGVAVVDDPPSTGSAYRGTCAVLRREGVPAAAITLLLPLFTDVMPPSLAGPPAVTLPFDRWAVHARLEPDAVAAVLRRLCDRPVDEVRRDTAAAATSGRGHVHATYEVLSAGETSRVEVRGVGQGLFGRHALAVADALGSAAPAVYGFEDGLLYSAAADTTRPRPVTGPQDAAARARYVALRAAALPATADRALDMTGRAPAWEVAARRLGRGYGRLGDALRLPIIDPAARRLCTARHPSIVDGATGPQHWHSGPAGALYKAEPDTQDFSNTDRYSYDAAFDLAGIAPGHPDDAVVDALRAVVSCSDEAYLLYELVQLEDPATGLPYDPIACSRAVRRYLAGRLPPPPAGTGPLCAFDLDGVLDSTALGFPITTPTAIRTLHALTRHGHRPVLVTGRSLPEVRQRCAAHGLVAGVAEYGAVIHRADTGATIDLLDPADRAHLDQIRAALDGHPCLGVHRQFGHSIRVDYTRESGARPGPVPDSLLEDLLGPGGLDRVRVIHGEGQTDIVTAGMDKGRGLTRLAAELGGRIALAVGDTAEDLPMLALADRALAPGNATAAIADAGVRRTRRHYAEGAAEAARDLLGHPPGGCTVCREPAVTDPDARLLLALLDASAGGRPGLPTAVRRAFRAVRTPR